MKDAGCPWCQGGRQAAACCFAGDTVILLRKPKKYSKAIAGMGKGLFGPGYLVQERESWQ